MAVPRVRRGRETEDMVAERWQENGLFPEAESIAASLPGRDIKNTPGFAVEVKARTNFSPLAWARQAAANAGYDFPVVVIRPNGMGKASLALWPVMMNMSTFEELVAELQMLRARVRSDPT